ncbi:hypothetical protein BC827DRAFT_741977 [Russula dissimulans]|nr:hypothetical protein BC827DRAFT_741977 [Russula dissimulans]
MFSKVASGGLIYIDVRLSRQVDWMLSNCWALALQVADADDAVSGDAMPVSLDIRTDTCITAIINRHAARASSASSGSRRARPRTGRARGGHAANTFKARIVRKCREFWTRGLERVQEAVRDPRGGAAQARGDGGGRRAGVEERPGTAAEPGARPWDWGSSARVARGGYESVSQV